jgi:hypothetical protein
MNGRVVVEEKAVRKFWRLNHGLTQLVISVLHAHDPEWITLRSIVLELDSSADPKLSMRIEDVLRVLIAINLVDCEIRQSVFFYRATQQEGESK